MIVTQMSLMQFIDISGSKRSLLSMILGKGRGLLFWLCFSYISIYTLPRILFTDYDGRYRMFSLSQPASMKMSWKKESFYVRKEFNSHRICLEDQHGRCFIVIAAVTSCENAIQFKYLAPARERDYLIPPLPPI